MKVSARTTKHMLGNLVRMHAIISFFEFESDLGLNLVFFIQSWAEDGSREHNMDVNTVHEEFSLQSFRKACRRNYQYLLEPSSSGTNTPLIANFPGEYDEYPTIEKYASIEATKTILPFTPSFTMRLEPAW